MSVEGYLSATAKHVTGITERQLTYWTMTGLIVPSVASGARGRQGGQEKRRWSFSDLVGMKTISDLRRAGVSLQALRKVGKLIASYGHTFADTYIVASGDDVLISTGEQMVSALRQPGQLALAVVYDLGRCAREVRTALKKAA